MGGTTKKEIYARVSVNKEEGLTALTIKPFFLNPAGTKVRSAFLEFKKAQTLHGTRKR